MFNEIGLNFVVQTPTITLTAILLGWYLYFQHCATYWKKKGVPTLPPSFPTGNIGASLLGSENLYIHMQKLYSKFKKSGHKYAGIQFFNAPVFLVIDPGLIKRILITDFDHFIDHGVVRHDEANYPLTANIFCQRGDKWRKTRNKFSPSFTSAKMKSMYSSIFVKNAQQLIEVMEPIARNRGDISIKRYLNMFTADILATSALGFEFNILKNPDQEISRILKNLVDRPTSIKLKTFLTDGFSKPGSFVKSVFNNAEAQEYLDRAIRKTIEYRKEKGIVVNDFFDALIKLEGISWNEIVGQAFLFFVAGYDTSSTAMNGCLHLLAYHQDVQDRLRQEIHRNLGRDPSEFTYDSLNQLSYLDNVLKEAMRLHPPLPILIRECVEEYVIPGTHIVLEKGTPLIIPSLGLHKDPDYFPEPLEFNPDRFDGEPIPFTYLPFGDGPRMCIGIRHGQLQAKLGVASIISKFKVSPSEKTPRYPEFEKIPSSPLLLFKNETFVRLEPLYEQ